LVARSRPAPPKIDRVRSLADVAGDAEPPVTAPLAATLVEEGRRSWKFRVDRLRRRPHAVVSELKYRSKSMPICSMPVHRDLDQPALDVDLQRAHRRASLLEQAARSRRCAEGDAVMIRLRVGLRDRARRRSPRSFPARVWTWS
jgi:hypothetical protein